MPRLAINNFLSWVFPRKIHINDNGTWVSPRILWVNNSGTWTRVHTRGLWFTITAGTDGTNIGYNRQFSSSPSSIGSASEVTLQDDKLVTSIFWNSFGSILTLTIGGFTSDPGADYFHSLVISGYGTVPSSALIGYSYGTAAQWGWSITQPFTNGNSYDIQLYNQ